MSLFTYNVRSESCRLSPYILFKPSTLNPPEVEFGYSRRNPKSVGNSLTTQLGDLIKLEKVGPEYQLTASLSEADGTTPFMII